MPYLDSLDLANRACQHLGQPRILAVDEDTRTNAELAFAYDKLRETELRRNVWRFSIQTAVLRAISATTMQLTPALWSATTLYLPGAIVVDDDGDFWTSSQPENVNNAPGQSSAWDQYFGPLTAEVWSSSGTYYAGDLAYRVLSNSTYVVFLSLQNNNSATPETAVAYDPTVTYGLEAVVSYSGAQWRSLLPFNLANTPAIAPAAWDAALSYGTGFTVTGSDGYVYTSLGEGNIGNNPPTDGGVHWSTALVPNAWSQEPTLYPSAPSWLPVYAALTPFFLASPIGYVANASASARNRFRLPANYLREAPQDPKAGSATQWGAPTGLAYNDWLFQDNFILSRTPGPIIFRFAADVTSVPKMDAMFCEGLAAKMALAACQPTTTSSKLKADIRSEYSQAIAEARLVNGIETGSEEPPEDDFLACRY